MKHVRKSGKIHYHDGQESPLSTNFVYHVSHVVYGRRDGDLSTDGARLVFLELPGSSRCRKTHYVLPQEGRLKA